MWKISWEIHHGQLPDPGTMAGKNVNSCAVPRHIKPYKHVQFTSMITEIITDVFIYFVIIIVNHFVHDYIAHRLYTIQIQRYTNYSSPRSLWQPGSISRYRTEGLSAVAGYDFTAIEAITSDGDLIGQIQLIGFREKLQDNPMIFMGKSMIFP